MSAGTDAAPAQVSFAQVGMWITERMGRAGSAYHMPLLITLDGPLDPCALIQACEALIRRHPILSSAIEERDGILVEVPGARPPIRVTVAGDLDELVREETLRPFDVERGPLARITLARVSPTRHVLIFVAHHLVFDGESKDVLVRDLAAFYNGVPLVRLPVSYAAHAEAERDRVAADLDAARDYWREHWREPGEVALPGLSGAPSRGAAEGFVHTFRAELPDVPGASRFEVFLACVHALLFAYGNAEPVCAIDVSTRTPEVRDHIGLFVNELPVSSTPCPGMTVAALAVRLHGDLREMYRFRPVPVARAVRGLRPRTALAPVSVSYRKRRADPRFAELDAAVDWTVFNHAVRSALHLQAVDGPDGLTVIMQYSSSVLVTQIAKDLTAIMKNPDTVLGEIVAGRTEPASLADEIRAIWQEVLGIDEIGDEEDLFDLGGHSLTITQIIARMRKRLGIEVPLDVFFDTPTIAGVLESIGDSVEAGRSDVAGSRR
ncbi:condensation domain-containing protein [Planotetraspora sp. A-T 1434]|uniref:condensation domain-containing protein n=1 Tax=Planotetraspora sp. A-T 1434 TaxID=2979219 RepID=UPI0021BE5C3A|nr:condensation domain-containing protein [Planotetraspora sp. A-T 1434]MCT9932894.1 condensation domain-containing protein [Planotetraspora sp. A-T 1434]